jgi:hypothetical protein
MPTRMYLHASGTSALNALVLDTGWEQTGQAVRLPMDMKTRHLAPTTIASSGAITIPITTTQQIACFQFTSNQVFAPARLDASCLFSLVIRTTENANTNNAFLAYVLRAVGAGDGSIIGTLSSSMTNAGTEFPLTASAATRIFGDGATTVAITATTMVVPWRLVLELGAHANGPTAAGSFTLRTGTSAATDFALTSALTTDLNPWMELSKELNSTFFRGYHQSIKVGDGMGCSERIR